MEKYLAILKNDECLLRFQNGLIEMCASF